MSREKKFQGYLTALAVTTLFLLTAVNYAQMGMRGPSLMGIFQPKVGAGAVYEMTDSQGKTSEMEMAVVGREMEAGSPAYWLEISFDNSAQDGMVMKYLMAPQGNSVHVYRIIMKNPQMGVMEMPEMMLSRMNQTMSQTFSANEAGMGKNLGTEVITTKAGAKKCTHWQKESQFGITDMWINKDVYPNSLVKSVTKTKEGTTHSMELVREITDAKTKITGEPQKMPMPGMRPPGR